MTPVVSIAVPSLARSLALVTVNVRLAAVAALVPIAKTGGAHAVLSVFEVVWLVDFCAPSEMEGTYAALYG
jgi:hypothetical protein